MRLIQFERDNGSTAVAVTSDGQAAQVVAGVASVYELAREAIARGASLAGEVERRATAGSVDYAALLAARRVLAPLTHPDAAHCLITGTGLTHLGSASARDKMHQKVAAEGEAALTDSMRIFKWGLDGGRPPSGTPGVQPEWFYKGDGHIVVRPGAPFPVPEFAEDAGEEPEVAGLYVIGDDRRPYRVGFAIGNEFSDHVMERKNYLYLAHSKLRFCSFGPELRTGPLPRHIEGVSAIERDGATIWEKPFLSGEDNMCHTLENLEYHHFKYAQFLNPGDVHIHFFGTATLSFSDGVATRAGDAFRISAPAFGAPLVNGIERVKSRVAAGGVRAL